MDGRVGTMFTETEFTMLAIDPEKMENIAWYREDFSDIGLSDVMAILKEDRPVDEGLAIPEGSQYLGVNVFSPERSLPVTVFARVKDGRGRYLDIELGQPAETEKWHYLEGRLTLYSTDEWIPSPMLLSCIYLRTESGGGFSSSTQVLYFDDMQVRGDAFSEPVIIEDYEDIGRWQVSPDDTAGSLSGTQTTAGTFRADMLTTFSGSSSGRFAWSSRSSSRPALYVNLDERPLAAVVSNTLLTNARIQEDSLVQIRLPGQFMYMTPVDTIDYFPSLDPMRKGFILVNLDRLLSIRNRQLSASTYPNEVWLTFTGEPETRAAAVLQMDHGTYGAREKYYRDAMLEKLKTDPLAGAGWSGMLTIAFLGVVLVSSLGFIVYSYLSAQQRQLDFAILRTLGFSLRQIIGLVCFEQLFIIIVGMGLGTFIGARLSNIMMPFLQLTEQGVRVLPPFILTVNWGTIGMAYGLLALAFVITISLVILFFSRVAIHKTLRMGDL